MDIVLFEFAKKLSDKYYNLGLEMAEVSDLSGAVAALNCSLKVNKKNVEARNLLGLCQYAMGRIGEALREWVISGHYQPENNLAKEYLETFNKNMPALERYSEAMVKYNEALVYMEHYSEDLAIIRLKRAIEILPNFVDAMNLLALHCLHNGDKTRAAALAEKVLSIDRYNDFAARYYREIFPKQSGGRGYAAGALGGGRPNSGFAAKAASTAGSSTSAENGRPSFGKSFLKHGGEADHTARGSGNPFAVRNQKVFTKASPLSGIISALLGMGAMWLFMYFLIFPGMVADRDASYDTLHTFTRGQQETHSSNIADLNEKIQGLNAQISELEGKLETREQAMLDLQNEIWVGEALAYLEQGLPSEALMTLENVDSLRLTTESRETYAHIRRVAPPQAEQFYLNQGRSYFNAGDFAQARKILERAAVLSAENSTIGGEILYLLGRIAENDADIPLAIMYYENLLESFPRSGRVSGARTRLGLIQQ
jgi:tetratricopeptide (TPR) repeat protein